LWPGQPAVFKGVYPVINDPPISTDKGRGHLMPASCHRFLLSSRQQLNTFVSVEIHAIQSVSFYDCAIVKQTQ